MRQHLSLQDARRIFGDDLVEPAALGVLLGAVDPDPRPIPFAAAEAEAAKRDGCVLVFRPDNTPEGAPLTLAALIERCATSGRDLFRFRGDDPWFAGEGFALTEVPERGWALFHREPWRETLSRTCAEGDAALRARAGGAPWRRRRAVETAFDLLAFAAARGTRLLERTWDWSSTPSRDGGVVNVGGFTEAGVDVLCYSRGVKHGALGICPTLVGRSAP